MGFVAGGLDLDGNNLVTTGKDEVYFVIMFAAGGGPGVVIELFSAGTEHLGHDVLIDITEVGGEFVAEEFLVDDVFGDGIVPECHRYKESRVSHVHLVLEHILMLGQADRRIVGVIGEIDSHAVLQVLDQLLHFVLVLRASKDTCDLIPGSVAGELGRCRHEKARGAAGRVDAPEIFCIEFNNLPF